MPFNPLTYFPKLPAPPNLPLAPVIWNARYQDQLSNVLRLYFNQLNTLITVIAGIKGGKFLDFPYGAFYQDGITTLSSNISNSSTAAISVSSTIGFPASGYILIGSEIIQYTTKTDTTFNGTITRGALSTTAAAHTAGNNITEVQGTGSPTTIGTLKLTSTTYTNGVTINNTNDGIIFEDYGLYNIQISVQILNLTNNEDNVTLWFVQNGTDIPTSASIQQVNKEHGGKPGAAILALNIFVNAAAGDTISVNFTSDTGDSVIATYPPGTSPVHPASPSVILTAQFVSAPPD